VRKLAVLLTSVAACGGSNGSSITCGDNTTQSGTMCVGVTGPDAGPGTTCGSGTHLSGTECVPDTPPTGAAPTVDSITPTHAGLSGLTADGTAGLLFQLTGTGFADPDAGEVVVTFGDVRAASIVVNDTTIEGWIPANHTVTAPVTVTDDNGTAQVAFTYDALVAAGGRQQGGHLFLLDPTNAYSADLGPIMGKDASNNDVNMGVSGLAFSSTGVLYGATVGDVPAVTTTIGYNRQLVTIDPATGTATRVGDLSDAGGVFYQMGDIRFSGDVLYGYGFKDDGGSGGYELVSVDPATGAVTTISTGNGGGYGVGFAFDDMNRLIIAGKNVGSELDTLDTATGSATPLATLDGTLERNTDVAPVNALAFEDGTLYGAVNTGVYSGSGTAAGPEGVLITIDPATGHVTEVGALPDNVDALEAAPSTLSIARAAHATWKAPPVTAVASRIACTSTAAGVPVHGGRVALARATRTSPLSLGAVARGALQISACGGATLTIAAADRDHYALVRNKHGAMKLVRDGKTVMRNVTAIDAK
jgi:hypothetical protein